MFLCQVCETLDRRKGLESSEMWPQQLPAPGTESPRGDERGNIDTDADEEVQQEASWEDWPVQAKLAMVLDHLRQNYHYCIFCGCQVSIACMAPTTKLCCSSMMQYTTSTRRCLEVGEMLNCLNIYSSCYHRIVILVQS